RSAEEREFFEVRAETAVPRLVAAIHGCPDAFVGNCSDGRARGIVRLLGSLGGAEAVDELRSWLGRDAPMSTRVWAARSLASLKDTTSSLPIARLLGKTEGRDSAEWLLKSLVQLRPEDGAALLPMLSEPPPEHGDVIITAIGHDSSSRSVEALAE